MNVPPKDDELPVEPDLETLAASMKCIEEGKTRPLEDVIADIKSVVLYVNSKEQTPIKVGDHVDVTVYTGLTWLDCTITEIIHQHGEVLLRILTYIGVPHTVHNSHCTFLRRA